jgi:hypothetical protein
VPKPEIYSRKLNYAAIKAFNMKKACVKDGSLRVKKGTYQ